MKKVTVFLDSKDGSVMMDLIRKGLDEHVFKYPLDVTICEWKHPTSWSGDPPTTRRRELLSKPKKRKEKDEQ